MRQGFNTVLCTNYESAMGVLGQSQISLFLGDIFMPGMGGIEGIRKIRDNFPDTVIVAMSGGWAGMSAENTISAAKKIGADACLEKPFTIKDIEKTLKDLVAP